MQNKKYSSREEKTGRGIIVGLFLALLVLEGARFFIDRSKYYIPSHDVIVQKYPLIDPARQFYAPSDLIINLQPLRDELSEIGKDQNVSIYFESLNTGANIAVNKDAEYFPASLLKVPLAIAAVKKIELGEWKWSDEFAIMESDKNKDFGVLWQKPIGTRITIEELIRQSLTNSDNTAHFMLMRNIKEEELLKVQEHLGLQEFFSKDGRISAKKYAPILRSLYSASYLSVEDSQKMLGWMSESIFNSYLAFGIPSSVKFAHKIGIEDKKGVHSDAGIVYLNSRPYLLIVMIKGQDLSKVQDIMHDISKKVYNYMANNKQ